MKKYKSSELTHKRAEVLKEAKANGVIIQECNTNGEVRCEYVIIRNDGRALDELYASYERWQKVNGRSFDDVTWEGDSQDE